ncbi:type II toxin-antitoxin system YoeB family toxin [Serratia symbiotica]|uniref:type II toxin-antitoxin system YoeB family toxin n=1 Tax=Serratia symbiotica TaxID=138074 RepID=UPI001D8F8586|nr:hypothetical protein [Serratia symbiotica]
MPTDYPYWQENNVKVDGHVCRFTKVTNTNPFTAISKPERRRRHKNPALYSRCIAMTRKGFDILPIINDREDVNEMLAAVAQQWAT